MVVGFVGGVTVGFLAGVNVIGDLSGAVGVGIDAIDHTQGL